MTGSRGATGEMVLVVTVALMLKCGAGRGRGGRQWYTAQARLASLLEI